MNKLKPLVSIIIPTYNRADVICNAIESVFNQTYSNFEIVVVDDGSNDNTGQVLSKFTGKINYIKQRNSGPSAARNNGVKATKGDIIAFLDSDDIWHNNKIEKQVNLLMKADSSVPCCLCNAEIYTANNKRTTSFELSGLKPNNNEGLWTNVSKILCDRFVLFNQALAVRRDAFIKAGGFDENLWILEDFDLAFRLSLLGPWLFINDPLLVYRSDNLDGLSNTLGSKTKTLQTANIYIYNKILLNEKINLLFIKKKMKKKLKLSKFLIILAESRNANKFKVIFIKLFIFLFKVHRFIYNKILSLSKMETSNLN